MISRALRDLAAAVVNFGARACQDHPIAVFQIADLVGERRQRDRVGADIHRAVAETDGERGAFACADQKIVFAGEQKRQCKSAAQPRQRRLHRVDRRGAAFHFLGHQMRDDFGIGLGREFDALVLKLAAAVRRNSR